MIVDVSGPAVPRLSRAAQSTFPKKPIKIIVTADAGGGEDTPLRRARIMTVAICVP